MDYHPTSDNHTVDRPSHHQVDYHPTSDHLKEDYHAPSHHQGGLSSRFNSSSLASPHIP